MHISTPNHGLAWWQGRIIPADHAALPLLTHALHYATCCIEGIRADPTDAGWGVLQLDGHLRRLHRNASILGLQPPSLAAMREAVVAVLEQADWRSPTYIRPMVFQAGDQLGPTLRPEDTAFACIVRPMQRKPPRGPGLRLQVSSWRRIDESAIPARLKSSAGYLTAALARAEAARSGCDDAILLDALGQVSEATVANVLLVRDGVIITPAFGSALLEGLTRGIVLDLARDLHIDVVERPIARGELACADEILLCGTAVELAWVGWLDGRPLPWGAADPGPVAQRLLAGWQQAREQRLDLIPSACQTQTGVS
jgi:branched-chain amino acid aminotransferase